ncbi:MAG: hypothetical protein MJ182_07095 [Treponema sp.]|nr:hypothetical protein [Treponema sp.]
MKKLVKRIGKLYFLLYMLLSMAGGITLSSCQNNVEGMLLNSNKHFSAKEVPYDNQLEPGDEGFREDFMLQSDYYVGNRMSLCLTAPPAESYYWSMYTLEKKESASWVGIDEVEETEFVFPLSVDQYSRNFTFYVPEVPNLSIGTYELVLTVYDKEGNKYTDSAQVVVYDQFFIELLE